jgi:ABC-2 type transport system permease protein
VWYVAATESGTISVPMRLIEDIGIDIASGQIAAEMQRPVSVLWLRILTEVGTCLPRLLLCVTVGSLFAAVLVGAPPDPSTLPLAAVSVVLAVTLNLIAQHLFAGAAFWLSDAKSTWFLYQKLVFILGGMLLPIEVLPDGLETVARFLPFVAMAYAPARLASGHFEPWLIVTQLGWIIVIGAGAAVLFRRGEQRIVRDGG